MVGQDNLLKKLKNNLPRNLILVGEENSGRKTLLSNLGKDLIIVEDKVEDLRSITTESDDVIICIELKINFNVVLKLLEEHKKSYIVIITESLESLPETLKSRCEIEYIENYSFEEIGNKYCDNVWQSQHYTDDLLEFVNTFIDSNPSLPNLFNVESYIKLREKDKGYDLNLFFSVLRNRLIEESLWDKVLIVEKFRKNKVSNKALLFREFLLEYKLWL